ncbi:MAG: hypothetical protein QXY50_07825 [Candidatus Caldarchaeum sp.]
MKRLGRAYNNKKTVKSIEEIATAIALTHNIRIETRMEGGVLP